VEFYVDQTDVRASRISSTYASPGISVLGSCFYISTRTASCLKACKMPKHFCNCRPRQSKDLPRPLRSLTLSTDPPVEC
jgi:hypothetical protein